METKSNSNSKPKIQIPIPRNVRRSSSSNSESQTHLDDSPHSPLRFHSPLRSDQGDPPETPPYSSPIASPEKQPPIASPEKPAPPPPPAESPMAIVAVDKFTQFSPALSPLSPQNLASAGTVPEVVLNRAVREQGPAATGVRKVGPEGRAGATPGVMRRSSSREERLKVLELGFRLTEVVLCLISFSVMAADKTQGWSGDSFDRYKEYRFCLAVNVIAFVYAAFQAYDLSYYIASGKHVIRHHLRRQFNFFMDQILAYLLVSASSSAATRVDDWQSNWGKDKFTEMATASVAMAFLAFIAFAASSLASGYHLCNHH